MLLMELEYLNDREFQAPGGKRGNMCIPKK